LVPTKAAAVLALRSPPSPLFEDQAERLPVSKPSAKIRSVVNAVEVGVAVAVAVGVWVGVGEGPAVDVFVGVKVIVGVPVFVAVGVMVGVFVGVAVGNDPVFNRLSPSTSFAVNPEALPSK
jgi:hypothetical protein